MGNGMNHKIMVNTETIPGDRRSLIEACMTKVAPLTNELEGVLPLTDTYYSLFPDQKDTGLRYTMSWLNTDSNIIVIYYRVYLVLAWEGCHRIYDLPIFWCPHTGTPGPYT